MKLLELDLTDVFIKQSSTEVTATPTANAVPIADSNGKLDGWVTAYSGTSPISVSGNTITISQASSSTNGYLSSTDWSNFNGKENSLGNPSTDGQILSSTTAGARSWIDPPSGGGSVGGVYGINVETLSGDKTLTPGTDAIYQYLDPNGADRTITLDTTNSTAGDRFVIRNDGTYTSSYKLKIQQGTTCCLGFIYTQHEMEWIFDGTNWVSQEDKYNYNVSYGYYAEAYNIGTAFGYYPIAYVRGVAVGYEARGYNYGVGVGYRANGGNYGTAVGYIANGSSYGVSVGYNANGSNYGIAVGMISKGNSYGVGIGYYANGQNKGLSIGFYAGKFSSSLLNPNQNLFIGYQTGMNVTTASNWAASTSYNVGDYVNPTSWNGYSYKCTVAGTTGSTEPTWPTTIGDTVTDGTVTWECVAIRGNNNIYIGYDIEGQQNDTNQLNIGNLIYGDLEDKYWMIPQNVNVPSAKSGFGIFYVASDGNLHYIDTSGTDNSLTPVSSGGSVGGSYGLNVESLSGDKTLTAGTDSIYQYLDPNGAYRTITLDTTNATAGDRFVIRNNGVSTSSSIYYLTIEAGSSTIGVQYPQQQVEWIYDGSNWVSLQDLNQRIVTWGYNANAGNYGLAIGYQANGNTYGTALGYNAQANSTGIAIGYSSQGYGSGAAIGHNSQGYNLGVAIGWMAKGYDHGVAVGCAASGYTKGVAIGNTASGNNYGVAIGKYSNGNTEGVAVGSRADGHSYGVAVGYGAYGISYNVSIGEYAGYHLSDGSTVASSDHSIYLGANTKSAAASSTNEIVIGYNVVGNGSNTVTIGNSDITDTFLAGNIHLTSVSTAPSTPSSGGILYVDTSGNLHYLGTSGTDTQIANA